MTLVIIDFLDWIKQVAETDVTYCKTRQQVNDCLIRKYSVENNLLYAEGGRLFVHKGGGLRRELLQETYDPQ